MLAANIGLIVLLPIIFYLLYIWYPYYIVLAFFIHLFSGDQAYLYILIYQYLIPYSIIFSMIFIPFSLSYFTIHKIIFPALYIMAEGEKRYVGTVYYYDRKLQRMYVKFEGLLNILRPGKSLSIIELQNQKIEKDGLDIIVKADGIVHITGRRYQFYTGEIPTQKIQNEIIEKKLDEGQARVGYRTMKSMHYNPELNKGKYKSVIALWPSWILKERRKAPAESYRGVIQTLLNNIDNFNNILGEALLNEEERENIAESVAPIVIQIFRDAKALEAYLPDLKYKNVKMEYKIKQMNRSLSKQKGKEIYFTVDLDTMIDYVRDVEAVLHSAEDLGVIEE